jgi:hypothetical protein
LDSIIQALKHSAEHSEINLSYYIISLLFIVKDDLYLKGPEELNHRLSITSQNSQDRLLKRLIIRKLNRSSEVGIESSLSQRLLRLRSSECFLLRS